MTDNNAGLDLLGAVKRQWWIVAVCAVAALGIAAAGSLGTTPIHVATASVHIDAPSIARTQGIPTADDLLGASNADLRARIKDAGGFTSAQMAGLKFQSVGSPTTRILVVGTSSSPDTAEKLAKVGAEQVVQYVRDSASIEIDNAEQRAAAASAALAAIPPLRPRGGTFAPRTFSVTPSDIFSRWSIEDMLLQQQGNIAGIKNIYRWDGSVSAGTQSKTSGLRSTLSAALLVGLFLGVVLGGVREYLYRRRNEPAA